MTKPKPKAAKPAPQLKKLNLEGIEVVELPADALPPSVQQGFVNMLRSVIENRQTVQIGDKVKIKASGLTGLVRGVWLSMDRKGPCFDVRYADKNGYCISSWFERDEIELIKAPAKPKAKAKAKPTTPKETK